MCKANLSQFTNKFKIFRNEVYYLDFKNKFDNNINNRVIQNLEE